MSNLIFYLSKLNFFDAYYSICVCATTFDYPSGINIVIIFKGFSYFSHDFM